MKSLGQKSALLKMLIGATLILSIGLYGPPLMALDDIPGQGVDPDGYELVWYGSDSNGTFAVRSIMPAPAGNDLKATFTAANGKKIKITSSQGIVNAVLPNGQITTQRLSNGNVSMTLRAGGQQVSFRMTPSGTLLDTVDQATYDSIRAALSSGMSSVFSSVTQFGLSQELLVQGADGQLVANPNAETLSPEGHVPYGVSGPIWKILVCVAAVVGYIASLGGIVAGCVAIVWCGPALAAHALAVIGVIDGCMMGWE